MASNGAKPEVDDEHEASVKLIIKQMQDYLEISNESRFVSFYARPSSVAFKDVSSTVKVHSAASRSPYTTSQCGSRVPSGSLRDAKEVSVWARRDLQETPRKHRRVEQAIGRSVRAGAQRAGPAFGGYQAFRSCQGHNGESDTKARTSLDQRHGRESRET